MQIAERASDGPPRAPQPVRMLLADIAARSPRARSILARAFPWKLDAGSEESWDYEYRAGKWDRLHDVLENTHYEGVASLCQTRGRPTVLDVACGSGVLLGKLTPDRRALYRGVDISRTAIKEARALGAPNAAFDVGDIQTFAPSAGRFDVIVFCEILQYFDDPQGIVERYARWLAPGGAIVISLSADGFRARLHMAGQWNKIRGVGAFEDRMVVEANHIRWEIRSVVPG